MERLPDQHGGKLQAPEGREVLYGRDHRLRRSKHQGPQDDPVCLQPLFQGLLFTILRLLQSWGLYLNKMIYLSLFYIFACNTDGK